MQDCLWVVRVRNVAADSKDVSAFFYVVLEVIIGTLVRKLRHFYLFRGKLFVEIVKIKAGRREVFDAGEKDGGL